jgi:hypothetical protein
MKTLCTFSLIFLLTVSLYGQVPSAENQIAATVLTLPENQRDSAQILGFNNEGSLIELRKGSNEFICLADDPNKPGYNSACYHKDLEDFMARGRELKDEGKGRKEKFDTRESEAKSGKLKMPSQARTLHIRYGKEGKYNSETNLVENSYVRYVVYIPWATSKSTGLPEKPVVPGGPWIMFPGTHSAHIMISPPKVD